MVLVTCSMVHGRSVATRAGGQGTAWPGARNPLGASSPHLPTKTAEGLVRACIWGRPSRAPSQVCLSGLSDLGHFTGCASASSSRTKCLSQDSGKE